MAEQQGSAHAALKLVVARRAARRRAVPAPPDSYRPWPCLVLAVDPGMLCGAAVYNRGGYIDSGHGDGYAPDFIAGWIERSVFFAHAVGLPLVLVMEKPPMGGRPYAGRSVAGAASVIGCRKLWVNLWESSAQTVNRLRCDVYPQTWRARTLGICAGPTLELMERARALLLSGHRVSSRDEAAAINIGEWACRAGAVGALFPARQGLR